jgi:hypothetical protein
MIPLCQFSAILEFVGRHAIIVKLYFVFGDPGFHFFVFFKIKPPSSRQLVSEDFFNFIGFITIDHVEGRWGLSSRTCHLMSVFQGFKLKLSKASIAADTRVMRKVVTPTLQVNLQHV